MAGGSQVKKVRWDEHFLILTFQSQN